MKTLLITKNIEDKNFGGRELLSKSNTESLFKIYSSNLEIYEIQKLNQSKVQKLLSIHRGYIDGVSSSIIKEITDLISRKNIEQVFIDGSNFGAISKAVKKQHPNVRITIFFHNSECRFFYGAFLANPSIHSAGVLLSNYYAEKFSVHFSDLRICLNHRDSELLGKIYKKKATHISELAMRDNFDSERQSNKIEANPNYESNFLLFVGGNFYANMDGIKWFLLNVAPSLDIKIKVVGRGLDSLKSFEDQKNIDIVGEVKDLSKWYQSCLCVIAPIFDGSGMKTKVAEALMFGRKVVGTKESFTGYEVFHDEIGWVCTSAKDFIQAIEIAQDSIINPFHENLREIFVKEFSQEAATLRLEKILQSSY